MKSTKSNNTNANDQAENTLPRNQLNVAAVSEVNEQSSVEISIILPSKESGYKTELSVNKATNLIIKVLNRIPISNDSSPPSKKPKLVNANSQAHLVEKMQNFVFPNPIVLKETSFGVKKIKCLNINNDTHQSLEISANADANTHQLKSSSNSLSSDSIDLENVSQTQTTLPNSPTTQSTIQQNVLGDLVQTTSNRLDNTNCRPILVTNPSANEITIPDNCEQSKSTNSSSNTPDFSCQHGLTKKTHIIEQTKHTVPSTKPKVANLELQPIDLAATSPPHEPNKHAVSIVKKSIDSQTIISFYGLSNIMSLKTDPFEKVDTEELLRYVNMKAAHAERFSGKVCHSNVANTLTESITAADNNLGVAVEIEPVVLPPALASTPESHSNDNHAVHDALNQFPSGSVESPILHNLLSSGNSKSSSAPPATKIFQCYFGNCSEMFKTTDRLLEHITNNHAIKLRFECQYPFCSFEDLNKCAIYWHLRKMHFVKLCEMRMYTKMFASPYTTELQNTLFENELSLEVSYDEVPNEEIVID